MRRTVIRSASEAEQLHTRVVDSAERTVAWLRSFSGNAMSLLRAMRFQTVGHDPLTGEPLNVVEQLNQTFTILVSLRAVERLFELHPEAGGYRLALGTSSGRDVESIQPGLVAAEVFSATRPESNQKLKKDVGRLASDSARYRYVFFSSPNYASGRQPQLETASGVEVHCIDLLRAEPARKRPSPTTISA